MIIIPGVIHQESWYMTTRIPGDHLIANLESGYNNDDLTIKWLAHFEWFSAKRPEGVYRLLLLDRFGSHCTKQFLQYSDQYKIIAFFLPPHSSHLLRLLDVVVFQPYKHYHAEAVERGTRSGGGNFDKFEFLDTIDTIRQQTLKPSTIRSAFRAIRLIPHNPDLIISKLRETPLAPSKSYSLSNSLSLPPVYLLLLQVWKQWVKNYSLMPKGNPLSFNTS